MPRGCRRDRVLRPMQAGHDLVTVTVDRRGCGLGETFTPFLEVIARCSLERLVGECVFVDYGFEHALGGFAALVRPWRRRSVR